MCKTQRSYGKPKTHRNISKNLTSKPYKKNIRDIRCWNCNEKGHYFTNCPKNDRAMMKTVHRALQRNPNTSEKILFELCYDFYNTERSSSSSSSSFESEHEKNVVTRLRNNDDRESDTDSEDSQMGIERLRELISNLSQQKGRTPLYLLVTYISTAIILIGNVLVLTLVHKTPSYA